MYGQTKSLLLLGSGIRIMVGLSLFLTIPYIGYANFAKSALFSLIYLFCGYIK